MAWAVTVVAREGSRVWATEVERRMVALSASGTEEEAGWREKSEGEYMRSRNVSFRYSVHSDNLFRIITSNMSPVRCFKEVVR